MAQKEKIQYIRYYAPGSAARKLERQPQQTQAHAAPVQVPQKRIPIAIEPVAVVGVVVALALLVCMVVGVVQLNGINSQISQMQQTVTQLQAQQKQLETQYRESYDLDEIRIRAEALGMVDSALVEHISVTLPEMEEEVPLTWWENLLQEIQGLFA